MEGAQAAAARGGTLPEVDLAAVAGRICRKLDGLPLAIELAAARMGTLSAAEIEARLSDRFRFLACRRPAADPRHQALQAAMDWSYKLLSPEERGALQELFYPGDFFADPLPPADVLVMSHNWVMRQQGRAC